MLQQIWTSCFVIKLEELFETTERVRGNDRHCDLHYPKADFHCQMLVYMGNYKYSKFHHYRVLLLLLFNTFTQGIYNYIPETNHVCRVYTVAAILWLQFMVHVLLVPMLNVL